MNDGRDLDKHDIWMDTFFDKNFKDIHFGQNIHWKNCWIINNYPKSIRKQNKKD